MADILTSIHGKLLGLDANGNLVNQYGQIISASALQNAGNTLYVSSVTGNAQGNGRSPQKPVASIAAAIALATANNGDVIVVLPDHRETLSGAGALALSKQGISVVGLGIGTQRPHLTLGGSAATTITVTAADIYFTNIVLVANFADIVTVFDVTANSFYADNVTFTDTSSILNFLRCFKASGAANTADGLRVMNSRRISLATDAAEFVSFVDNAKGVILANNLSISAGTAALFVLSAGTKILTDVDINHNRIQMAGTSGNLFITNGGTGNSGIVSDNYCGNLDVTGAQTFGAAAGLQFFNNLMTSTSTESGALSQAADTPLS